MNDLQQKYEQAKSAYARVAGKLDLARSTYDNGAGKAFSEAKKNRETLVAQLDSEKQASERAKASLADAMRASKGARTSDVDQALSARRNADDLIDQLGELLKEADKVIQSTHAEASEAARGYIGIYADAAQRWAEMNVLEALIECGDRIARAMAVKTPKNEHEGLHAVASCEQLVINELRLLAEQFDKRAYVQEIGTVELGGMERRDILSPVQINTAQKGAGIKKGLLSSLRIS